MAYCGSGYNKRRKYAVHAEWEWKHFQEFLGGFKLKSEKNDLFRHLMVCAPLACHYDSTSLIAAYHLHGA